MKNYKTIIIAVVSVFAVILLIIFAVQSSGNKAISYEENVATAQADCSRIMRY